ncbi:elongator complex protein 5 isoform X2 [Eulemur rufifrons]|uniref:elongator complex protein 5 isoform X2 n=1 Tax=Eulemur rufifrons TaxID=859984 RepID=UPI0037433051
MVGGIINAPPLLSGRGGQWAMTPSGGARGETGHKSEMLDSLLGLGGLMLLRDSLEWEGRSLLKALIKKSALSLVYHDFFRDPLNWSKTGEALPGGPLGALTAMCKRTDPGPVTIALDSLSWLLLHLPCTTLCQSLHALSHQDSCPGDSSPVGQVRVLGLLHEELHGPGPVGALSSLAQTEVTLGGTMGQASAHILCRRPQQRPTHQTHWFCILPDFSLDLQEGPPVESQPHPDPRTSPVDPTTHLTFNLHLSKKEREARDSLTLPFQFSSEKQQALLRPGPGQATSHIFYEPDAYDDLDQEDPDDDLDI